MPTDPQAYQLGDAIYFSGRGPVAFGINVFTGGWPFLWPVSWTGFSHVATVGMSPYVSVEPVLWESTTGCRLPDLFTGNVHNGVQAHPIADRIAEYRGRVWHFPLTPAARLTFNVEAAQAALWAAARRPYDYHGAWNARGTLLGRLCRRLCWHRCDAAFYCSELRAGHLRGGLGVPADTQFNPNRLFRLERSQGIVAEGRRVK